MSSEASAEKSESSSDSAPRRESGVTDSAPEPLIIGRYALFDALASGGMATVHLGRLLGSVGFGRTVAVKRLHSHYTSDQDFVTMFMDEARIVARIRHPNVVPMVDVIESSKGLFLIMEYVHGESFSKLLRTCRASKQTIPIKLITAIMHGVLLGLHAAHETKGTNGELLNVVHRDVSPQNIIVGADGVARVLDFGVAKAAGRAQVTREGQIKGKLAYMAPEQIRGMVDRRADVFAAAVVLWEALAGRRLHEGAKDVEIVTRVVQGKWQAPSEFRPDVPPELDAIVLRGLDVDPEKRYSNARDMALDLERKVGLAPPSEVGEWVEKNAPEALRHRAERVAAMEKVSGDLVPIDSVPPPPNELDAPFSDDIRPPLASTPNQELTKLMDGAPPPPASSDAGLASQTSTSSQSGVSGVTNGTPIGTAMPIPLAPAQTPRRDLAPIIALVSFCGALALVGAALGAYSLYARSTAGAAAPSATITLPSASAAPSATPRASASAGTQTSPEPSTKPTQVASPSPASPRPNGSASPAATPSATASSSPSVHPTARPAPLPSPAPAPTPTAAKKANCDPPYTVDEQGHRHYKLECMDNP